MLSRVRDTSKSAYASHKKNGGHKRQIDKILHVLTIYPNQDFSLRELSKWTGFEINAVSGRCNELKKNGSIIEGEKRPCLYSGKTIHPLKIAPAIEN